jgi:hypothetical protein
MDNSNEVIKNFKMYTKALVIYLSIYLDRLKDRWFNTLTTRV